MRQGSPVAFAFNHFGYVFNDLCDSQTINFPYNDQTSGSHPTLRGLWNSATTHGMRSTCCQQSELCCWALTWHRRIFYPSLCLGLYTLTSCPFWDHNTDIVPHCPARHPASFSLAWLCQRESGMGRREGRGWRIKQDRPESLEFFP